MSVTSEPRKVLTWQQFSTKLFLSASSAAIAESCTFPLDICKTRLQVQGQAAVAGHTIVARHHRSVRKGLLITGRDIVVKEGLFKLWSGLAPAVCRHIIYTSSRMVSYEVIRDYVCSKSKDNRLPVWKSALCAISAGCFGQMLATPADLVKVQMQTEGKRRLEGHPTRYRSSLHALSELFKQNGLRGMWRGWAPGVQRAALVNLGDLTTYDTVKRYLLRNTTLEDNWICHFCSSGCSGMVAAVLSCPADVVKTRMMSQMMNESGQPALYRSSVDCLIKTIRHEGPAALYKGFIPCYSRMAPWSLIFWLSYEEIRRLCGIKAF